VTLPRRCAGGKVGVFDLRKPEPLVVKDHLFDAAIVDLKFHRAAGDHTGRQRIISADSHIVKVRPALRASRLLHVYCTLTTRLSFTARLLRASRLLHVYYAPLVYCTFTARLSFTARLLRDY